jgi:acyl-CoA synthetase (AMP-forming)/AMP-acid ligase II
MLNSIKGPFVRRKFSALKSESKENKKAICSVLQLIEHNAEENPNHVFCLQAEKGQESVGLDSDSVGWNVRRISFKDLYHAVADCCSWLRNNLVGSSENSLSVGQSPVAVYLESDVTLFLFVVAITALNHPVTYSLPVESNRA